jgi:hypothetical protein
MKARQSAARRQRDFEKEIPPTPIVDKLPFVILLLRNLDGNTVRNQTGTVPAMHESGGNSPSKAVSAR